MEFLLDVNMMFPYMDGEIGIGEPIKLPVEASAGDVLS
jgi:hypothetical protein